MNRIPVLLAFAVIMFFPLNAQAVTDAGASRDRIFELAAQEAAIRGDVAAASALRALGNGPATVPPEISGAAARQHPDYAAKYAGLRERVRSGIQRPLHTSDNQWRLDRAEADLHWAARELEKKAAASTALLLRLLTDASWAVNHEIIPYSGAGLAAVAAPAAAPAPVIAPAPAPAAAPTPVAPAPVAAAPAAAPAPAPLPEAPAPPMAAATPPPPAFPTAAIAVNPQQIVRGSSARLTWGSTNASSVEVDGRREALDGSRNVSPDRTTRYAMTATGPGGRATAAATLTVVAPQARFFRIHFDFDESVIRPDAIDTMIAVANFLRANPDQRMRVEGHCDWMGTDAYNVELGMRRAQSVRDFFVERYGLSPETFDLVSKGEAEPIASNAHADGSDNPIGRQLNRRAEFVEITP